MELFYTCIILFLIVIALFLGQIAMQFIKLERKVELAVETLEEELIDVFGMHPVNTPEPKEAASPADAKPAKPLPDKKPEAKTPAKPEKKR